MTFFFTHSMPTSGSDDVRLRKVLQRNKKLFEPTGNELNALEAQIMARIAACPQIGPEPGWIAPSAAAAGATQGGWSWLMMMVLAVALGGYSGQFLTTTNVNTRWSNNLEMASNTSSWHAFLMAQQTTGEDYEY